MYSIATSSMIDDLEKYIKSFIFQIRTKYNI